MGVDDGKRWRRTIMSLVIMKKLEMQKDEDENDDESDDGNNNGHGWKMRRKENGT